MCRLKVLLAASTAVVLLSALACAQALDGAPRANETFFRRTDAPPLATLTLPPFARLGRAPVPRTPAPPAAFQSISQPPAAGSLTDDVPDIVIGAGAGGSLAKVLSGIDGSELAAGAPFGPAFTGGVRVAAGDVNGDGVADFITGTGYGAAQVRIFNGVTADEIASVTAFSNFTGGVYVAAGDVNNDGFADVIVGAGAGGGLVRVFSGFDRREMASGYPFGPGFTGGVSVAVGDVNADGQIDYIVGMALGGLVRVFDGTTLEMLGSGFPYGPFYVSGVMVAAGDVTGDGRAEVITGAQLALRPPVRVFDLATRQMIASFDPANDALGVRVAAGDVNGDGFADVITGAGLGGQTTSARLPSRPPASRRARSAPAGRCRRASPSWTTATPPRRWRARRRRAPRATTR